jgi:hypothetical protein
MLLIAHNSERRKSCSNYNLRRIPQTVGFAPAAAFLLMFRHCLLSFPTEATEVLLCISWCHLPRQQEVGPVFRDSGSARPSAGLRLAERATRSRAPAQFQKQDPSVVPNGDVGNGRRCRALEKQPQFRVKPFATCRREDVKAQKSRHDPVSENAAPRS